MSVAGVAAVVVIVIIIVVGVSENVLQHWTLNSNYNFGSGVWSYVNLDLGGCNQTLAGLIASGTGISTVINTGTSPVTLTISGTFEHGIRWRDRRDWDGSQYQPGKGRERRVDNERDGRFALHGVHDRIERNPCLERRHSKYQLN